MIIARAQLSDANVCEAWQEAFDQAFPSGRMELNLRNFNKLVRTVELDEHWLPEYTEEDLYNRRSLMGKRMAQIVGNLDVGLDFDFSKVLPTIRKELRRRARLAAK